MLWCQPEHPISTDILFIYQGWAKLLETDEDVLRGPVHLVQDGPEPEQGHDDKGRQGEHYPLSYTRLLLQVLTELKRMQTNNKKTNSTERMDPPMYPAINDKVTFNKLDETVGMDNKGLLDWTEHFISCL